MSLNVGLSMPDGMSRFEARTVGLPEGLERTRRLGAAAERPIVTHNRADEFDESEPGHVYIGRHTWNGERVDLWAFLSRMLPSPMRGWLGNPWPVDANCDRGESIRRYRQLLAWGIGADEALEAGVRALEGCTLGCWCRHSDALEPACHGDVLAEFCRKVHADPCEEHRPAAFPVPRWSRHHTPTVPYTIRCEDCYRRDAGPVVLSASSTIPIHAPPPGGTER